MSIQRRGARSRQATISGVIIGRHLARNAVLHLRDPAAQAANSIVRGIRDFLQPGNEEGRENQQVNDQNPPANEQEQQFQRDLQNRQIRQNRIRQIERGVGRGEPARNMQNDSNNMDTNNPNVQNDGSTNADGNGGAGASGSSVRGEAFLPGGLPFVPTTNTSTYTKNYRFRISNRKIEYTTPAPQTPGANNTVTRLIRYPYYDLPVANLGFYLSEEEIHRLVTSTTSAKVLKCEVEVFNHIANLPFATASSTTTLANNNVGISLCQIDPSINKYRQGVLPGCANFIQSHCWGEHFGSLPASATWSSNDIGKMSAEIVTRDLDLRFEYACTQNETTGSAINNLQNRFNYRHHAFPITAFINKQINASFNEGSFCSWTYEAKNGFINRNPGQLFTSLAGADSQVIPTFGPNQLPSYSAVLVSSTAGVQADPFSHTLGRSPEFSTRNDIVSWVPAGGMLRSEYPFIQIDDTGMKGMPALCFGMYPKITGDVDPNQGGLVDAQIEIEVKVVCIIEETYGNNFMYRFGGNTVQPDHTLPMELTWTRAEGGGAIEERLLNRADIGMANHHRPQMPWPVSTRSGPEEIASLSKRKKETKERQNKQPERFKAMMKAAEDYNKYVSDNTGRSVKYNDDSPASEYHKLRNGKKYLHMYNMENRKTK